jgi:hypothetical protein
MQKNILWLLLFLLTGSAAFSQHKEKEWTIICGDCSHKKVKDTLRRRWHPYAGIHVSGDAAMVFIGPSFQAGVDFQLKRRVVLSAYLHYFHKKINNVWDGGGYENGRFKTITGTILCQANSSRNPNKSFFIAGGVAIQRWMQLYNSDYNSWDDKRTTVVPAARLGYFFPIGDNKITVELNATGPYSYGDANSSVLEILTQVSFGFRYIF